jgi:hypothetical protein
MAPIIAIGSSALVAGSAGTAGATVKKANPTITIVDAVPGAFRFSVNGSIVSLKNQRGVFTGKVGVNHVSEVSAPAVFRTLSSISVSPPAARVSSSLKAGTVTLKLAAGRAAIVTFVNSKLVVKMTSAPVAPAPVAPAPVAPAPVAPAPVNPPPVVTNPTSPPPPGDGYIEVCKTAADAYVAGTFTFTVSDSTGLVGTYSLAPVFTVNKGSVCTGPIAVPAGTVAVAELTAEAPGYALQSVLAAPVGNLGTYDLAAQTANFNVTLGLQTTATFVDATQYNYVKVCKVLKNNLGNLAGTTFSYTVSWVFTPPIATGAAAFPAVGDDVTVVAVAAPGKACSVVPSPIPAGSVVTATEDTAPANVYVSVTDVSIVPFQFAVTTPTPPAATAVLTVPPVGDGYADAVFTDTPMGFIEVCKYFDPSWGNPQQSFYDNPGNVATFTVSSGSPFPLTTYKVDGGSCTNAIEVPAGTGTTTVTETVGANYQFEYVTAEASVAGVVYDELTGLTIPPAQLSESTVNPAVVSVPYGAIANDTSVKFWDAVDPIFIKVCVQDTSVYTTGPKSETIGFTYTQTGSFSKLLYVPIVTGAGFTDQCKFVPVTDAEYVVNPNGSPYVATVTEDSITPSAPGVVVNKIVYYGGGSVTTNSPPAISFTVGNGNNEVDFTLGPAAQ